MTAQTSASNSKQKQPYHQQPPQHAPPPKKRDTKRKRSQVPKGSFEFVQQSDEEIKQMIDKYHQKMDEKESSQGLAPYGSTSSSEIPKSLEIQKKKSRKSKPYDPYVTTFQFK